MHQNIASYNITTRLITHEVVLLHINVDVISCLNLTHRPLDKYIRQFADDVFRCMFVNEKFCILIKKKNSIGLDNVLAPNRRHTTIWTTADPIYWRIYAALGGDELT